MITQCLLVAVVLAALVGAGSALAAPAASAGGVEGRKVALPAQFVYDFKAEPYICAQCGPGGTPIELIGCGYVVFVQFPVVARATTYAVTIADHHPRINRIYTLTGPPFSDDKDGYTAPAGTHRLGWLTGGSYTASEESPCPPAGDATQNGRFELIDSYALIEDDGKLHVSGTVVDADGKGVAGVKVRVGGKKDTTDASGGYDVVVKKGTYTVSAAGYCVVGKPGCAKSASVKLPPNATVDFGPPPEHTLAGSVFEQTCTAESCTRAGLSGVTVRASGGPGGPEEISTGADGSYSLTLREGTWRVEPLLAGREFEQVDAQGVGQGVSVASVRLGADVSGLDFQTCAGAESASAVPPPGLARTLVGGGCLRISGTVTRRVCNEGRFVTEGTCTLVLEGAPERAVSLRGPSGTIEVETNADGAYSAIVRPGRWVVHVPGPRKSVEPATRVVDVGAASVVGVDFNLCKLPDVRARIVRRPSTCKLVRIDGTTVDIDGSPLPEISVEVEGTESATSDASGRFTVHAPAGRFKLKPVRDNMDVRLGAPLVATVRSFDTDEDVAGVELTVKPHVDFRLDTDPGYTTKVFRYNVGGIPVRERAGRTLTLRLKRTQTTPARSFCRFNKTAVIDITDAIGVDGRELSPAPTFGRFCDGDYVVTLTGGGRNDVGGRVLERQTVYFGP